MNKIAKFFKSATTKKTLVITALVGFVLSHFIAPAYAEDLLASGDETVKQTLGKDSSIVTWLLILEVLGGVFTYVKTKNLLLLGGFIAAVIAINIGFNVIGA